MNRRALYDYLKLRKQKFTEQVFKILGNKCEVCNQPPTRIEFRNLDHPFRAQYSANRVTLYRMVLDGEFNSGNLVALCNDCWIDNRRDWREKHGNSRSPVDE